MQSEASVTTLSGSVAMCVFTIVLCLLVIRSLRDKKRRKREYQENLHRHEREYRKHLLELAGKPGASPPEVMFKTRPKNGICCPYCWTVQLSNRNYCRGYGCEATFVFQDESNGKKACTGSRNAV